MAKQPTKETGDKVSAIASRILRQQQNPLDNPEVREALTNALQEVNDRVLSGERVIPRDEVATALVEAVRGVLDDYFADARTVAASALSQDETP